MLALLSRLSLLALLLAAGGATVGAHTAAAGEDGPAIRLAGHVPRAVHRAKPAPARPGAASEPLTLTVVLRRSDEAGFERFVRDVYDPASPSFHRFARPAEVAERFGPTRDAYAAVRSYLEARGLEVVEGSPNRLTLTVRGSRDRIEHAFALHIRNFELDGRVFQANDAGPLLDAAIAQEVHAIVGLSDLAVPMPAEPLTDQNGAKGVSTSFVNTLYQLVGREATQNWSALLQVAAEKGSSGVIITTRTLTGEVTSEYISVAKLLDMFAAIPKGPPVPPFSIARDAAPLLALPGGGQKLGVLAFSSFRMSDVADFLALMGLPASQIANVSEVAVNGGAPLGTGQSDVLLAIEIGLIAAPGAEIVVYDAPFSTSSASFQALFNRMINDGVTVITNSWNYCEDQTTAADAQSVDSILAAAAAAGITVLNATGDDGSACNDGSPDTIAVPADSPNATAVGGSSPDVGPAFTYLGETWWDGSTHLPPDGQGGFGVSRFFARPSYQNSLIGAAARSVPDVVAAADPRIGVDVCEADRGGCPTGLLLGGTSLATHLWAAFVLRLNDELGHDLGFLNPLLYPLANTDAFHSAANLSSDVDHVGLGSPNVDRLGLALAGKSPGPVNGATSRLTATSSSAFVPFSGSVTADGTSAAAVIVAVRDVDGHLLSGKQVVLSGNGGSHAVISPPSATSSAANGAAVFLVTDSTPEVVSLSATADGVALLETADVTFTGVPASAGGISAAPAVVNADGTATTTITVTLQDEHGAGAPAKLVSLAQGGGHSVITGPSPAATDATGKVQFTATDTVAETVTYTAVDVSDGRLPVPGSAEVTFAGAGTDTCHLALATASPGFALTPFATGFPTPPCLGPIGMAFDGAGNLFVADASDGNLYRFGSGGGAAGPATRITGTPSPLAGYCPTGLAFSKDGQHLYVARQYCSIFSGDIVEIDPADGTVLRTLAGLACATGLATDPVSGDLFASSPCGFFGDPHIYRIANPDGPSPQTTIYSMPGYTDGITFGPDGTLYSESANPQDGNKYAVRIEGTASATPGAFTYLAAIPGGPDGIAVAPDPGDPTRAQFLFVNRNDGVLSKLDLTQDPPLLSDVFSGGSRGDFVAVGPDGCTYATQTDSILRVTNADGSCPFAATNAIPTLSLNPIAASPNPKQGSSQTFTATLRNAAAPPGTSVTLLIAGAHQRILLGHFDASGRATFTYPGIFPGEDTLVASTTIDGQDLASNTASVVWDEGLHWSFIAGMAPKGGSVGSAVALTATLYDISAVPTVPVSGATLHLSVGGVGCSAVTDASGAASCSVVPQSAGLLDFDARYDGGGDLLASRGRTAFASAGPLTTGCGDACTIPAVSDSFLRHSSPNQNEGANTILALQSSGSDRPIIAFDPDALARATFSRARLVLTIKRNFKNWGRSGRALEIHPLLADFVEGNGANLGARGALRSRGTGPGVTWSCATDASIGNVVGDCPAPWDGGAFGPTTSSLVHTNGLRGEVSWDVTADVRAGRSAWLLKKANERQSGHVEYYSREGAAAMGDASLAPRLVLDRGPS